MRRMAALPPAPPPGVVPQVPVGTVMAYAGEVIPAGWMLCDGHQVSRRDVPELFVVIKHHYDPPTTPTLFDDGVFYLPDFRGRFLRGLDIDKDGKTANPPRDVDRDSKAGLGFASVEDDQIGYHVHEVYRDKTSVVGAVQSFEGLANAKRADDNWTATSGGNTRTLANDLANGQLADASKETRPKNIAVYWIIRYRSESYPDASYVPKPR